MQKIIIITQSEQGVETKNTMLKPAGKSVQLSVPPGSKIFVSVEGPGDIGSSPVNNSKPDLTVKRVGNHLRIEDGEEVLVEVIDFYTTEGTSVGEIFWNYASESSATDVAAVGISGTGASSDAEAAGMLPLVSPVILGGISLVGAALSTGGSSIAGVTSTETVVSGLITAGNVIPGHGLKVVFYNKAGVLLDATPTDVDVNGYFSKTLKVSAGEIVIAKVVNRDTGNDYNDEATNANKDLNAQLLSVGIANGGAMTLNINPLTTIAAQKAGLAANGTGTVLNVVAVTDAVTAVEKYFGLTDITTATPDVTNDGAFNGTTVAGKIGAVLAAMSGIDLVNHGNSQTTINNFVASITGAGATAVFSVSEQLDLLAGAVVAAGSTVGGTSVLINAVSDTLAAVYNSTGVSVDRIANDNVVDTSEKTALLLTGTVATGATSVTLDVSGIPVIASISGTHWAYTLSAGDLLSLGTSGVKYITATAFFADATTTQATRTFFFNPYSDLPSIMGVTLADGTWKVGSTVVLTITAGNNEAGLTLSSRTFNGQILTNVVDQGNGTYTADYTVQEGDVDRMNGDNVITNLVLTNARGDNSETKTSVTLSGESIDANSPTLSISDIISPNHIVNTADKNAGVTIRGTTNAENGQSVMVSWGGHSQVANLLNGNWETTFVSANVPPTGTTTVTANVADASGNVAIQASQTVTLDLIPPAVGIDVLTSGAGVLGDIDNVLNRAELLQLDTANLWVITGTTDAEVGQTVALTLNNATYLGRVTSAGIWRVELAKEVADALVNGNPYAVTVNVSNLHGNSASSTKTLDVRTAPPDVPTIDAQSANTYQPILSGTARKETAPGSATYIALQDGDAFTVSVGSHTYSLTLAPGVATSSDGYLSYNAINNTWRLTTPAGILSADGVYDVGVGINAVGYSTQKTDVSTGELVIKTVAPVVMLNDISTDNIINVAEHNASILVGGTVTDVHPVSGANTAVGGTVNFSFNGQDYTAEVQSDGTWSRSIPASDAQDLISGSQTLAVSFTGVYGNTGTASQAVMIDVNAPTISDVSLADGAWSVGEAVTLTLTAGGNESGLTLNSDATFNGRSVTGFHDNGNGTYNVTYTVGAGDTNRNNGAGVPAHLILLDAHGNESAETNQVTLSGEYIDTTVPVFDNQSTTVYVAVGISTATAVYDANATDDVGIGDAGITYSLSGTDAGLFNINAVGVVTYKVIPTSTVTQNIDIVATDAAGNAATKAVTINLTSRPTVTITDDRPGTLKVGESATFTFTFSEVMHGFDVNAVRVGGGTKGTFTASVVPAEAGKVYTLEVTPTASTNSGLITIDVDASAALDSNNIGNTAATQHTQSYDTLPPSVNSVVISGVDSANAAKASTLVIGDKINILLTMSEATVVTGTPSYSINVGGSTKTASYVSGTGTTELVFQYTIVANDTDSSGGITAPVNALALGGGTISDATNNAASLGTAEVLASTNAVKVDTVRPSAPFLSLGTGVADGATAAEATAATGVLRINAQFDSSWAVSFTGTSGLLVTKTGTGTDAFQAVVLSSADLTTLGEGAVTVSAMATDAAGTSPARTSTFDLDTVAPTLTPTVIAGPSNVTRPVITGTVGDSNNVPASGETLSVTVRGATYANVEVKADGTWSVDTSKAPTSGSLGSFVDGGIYDVTATLTDSAGNSKTDITAGELTIDFSLPTVAFVPGTTPDVDGNSRVLDTGNVLTYTVTYDENVHVVTPVGAGAPTLGLRIGSTQQQALLTSVDHKTLTFTYTLQDADFDVNGVSVPASGSAGYGLKLNGSVIYSDALITKKMPGTTGAVLDDPAVLIDTISLGVDSNNVSLGSLIRGVQVEGKWYYTWDRNNSGTMTNADLMTHDVLDAIFNKKISGEVNGGVGVAGSVLNHDGQYGSTDVFRFGSLNGLTLALPTFGGTLNGSGSSVAGYSAGTAYSNTTGDAVANSNVSYNDLLAIWDAYNGTGTQASVSGGVNYSGVPTGWRAGGYWAATTSSTNDHAGVFLNSGYTNAGLDTALLSVAFQVL